MILNALRIYVSYLWKDFGFTGAQHNTYEAS